MMPNFQYKTLKVNFLFWDM